MKPIVQIGVGLSALAAVGFAIGVLLWPPPSRRVAGFDVTGPVVPGEAEVLSRVASEAPATTLVRVEWVREVWTPSAPGTCGEGCEPAGSYAERCPTPWTCYRVVVVAFVDRDGKPVAHARQTALAHELVLHAYSDVLGRGRNAQHTDRHLAEMLARIER